MSNNSQYHLNFNVQLNSNEKFNVHFKVKKNIYDLLNGCKKYIQSTNNNTIFIDDTFFDKNSIVKDECRYSFEIKNGVFINKNKISSKTICKNTKSIVLLLESPHKLEYKYENNRLVPIGPAQGKNKNETGGAIDNYLKDVMKEIANKKSGTLQDGNYILVIVNPIQFQTSLISIHQKSLDSEYYIKTLRNNVWKNIWNINSKSKYPIQDDFIKRLDQYKPYMIINTCTSNLQKCVSSILNTRQNYIETYHPSVNWNQGRFGIK